MIVGKGARWADDAVADWGRRVDRLVGFSEDVVKPERFRGDVDAVRDAEADKLLKLVRPRDRLVAVDERGLDLSTHGFSDLVDHGIQAGGDLVFAIGGPYGHGAALRDAAWRVVRLSGMVLNHDLARVVLVEQVYRALTLQRNIPYHH